MPCGAMQMACTWQLWDSTKPMPAVMASLKLPVCMQCQGSTDCLDLRLSRSCQVLSSMRLTHCSNLLLHGQNLSTHACEFIKNCSAGVHKIGTCMHVAHGSVGGYLHTHQTRRCLQPISASFGGWKLSCSIDYMQLTGKP